MLRKFLTGEFGTCPRALCDNQKCIPIGLSEKLRSSRVKIFCPKCDEVYMIQKYKSGVGVQTATSLDGSYFGQSFPHIFLTTFDNYIEQQPKEYLYEPQISGFKIAGQRGSKFFNPQRISSYQAPISTNTCYTLQSTTSKNPDRSAKSTIDKTPGKAEKINRESNLNG